MPQRHRSVVPNPATSGNRQYIRNKVKQSKPIAVVQWQETSLWQQQNLSGDISKLMCRLMVNESQKQLSHASELTSVLTVVQLSCLEGSYSDDVKGQSDDSLDQLSLLFIRRDVGIGAWRRTFQVKGIVVFSSNFHDIFYVWKLNAEKPKKTTRKIWKLFTDFFRNLQTNKQNNHKFGGTNSKFDVSLRKWNHHSRFPENRAEEGAEAALQGGQRGLDLKLSFCFF